MPTIITRAQWGARSPKATPVRVSPSSRTGFMTHYSGANKLQTVRSIQNYCMDNRGFNDIDYNFLVDYKGNIYEGRGWDVVGSHVANNNTPNIGVCAIGVDADITDAQKSAIAWLYAQANARCKKTLKKLVHSDLASTSCPGSKLRAWVKAGMVDPIKPPAPTPPKPTPPAYPKFAGKVLKRGMNNNAEVGKFQLKLKQRGWRITVDNDFGPATEAVVKSFQREKGLPVTGQVNKTTWDKIYTAPVTNT